MILLAIDPGEHNGFATMRVGDNKIILVDDFGVLDRLEFYKKFEYLAKPVDLVLVEDFKTRPTEARSGAFDWNRMVACKVIGAIEYACLQLGKTMILQQPAVKPMGYGFLGKQYRKGQKGVHHWDAVAHGYYYLVLKKLGQPIPH